MALRRLEFEALRCSYGFEGMRELAPFSPQTFTLEPGDMTTVEGDNGSGKTSLLRTLLNQVPKANGTVKVVRDAKTQVLDIQDFRTAGVRIFYLPQRVYNLFPVENCVETAASLWGELGGRYRTSEARWKLYENLDAADLMYRIRYRRCENLTGGESQIFAVVLGFLCRADLVLLDEPTAALSQENRPKVRELIRKLLKPNDGSNVFCLIVTHDCELSNLATQHIRLSNDGHPV